MLILMMQSWTTCKWAGNENPHCTVAVLCCSIDVARDVADVDVDVVHVDIDVDVVDVAVDVDVEGVDVDVLFCQCPLCLLLCS